MIRKIFILSIILTINSLIAKESIILVDNSKKGNLTQKEIKGCDELIVKEQKRDIEHIKHQLSIILKKLSEIEKEKNISIKSRKIRNIRKSIKRVNRHRKNGTYITIRVKRGDRLADYAKKYYGNSRLYYKIYRANRDKIGKDLKLRVGDRIIIPIDKHYKYKKFKHRKQKRVKEDKDIEIASTPIEYRKTVPVVNYSRAKFISPNRDRDIEILDEPVYIDDENSKKIDTSDFIPLDEN